MANSIYCAKVNLDPQPMTNKTNIEVTLNGSLYDLKLLGGNSTYDISCKVDAIFKYVYEYGIESVINTLQINMKNTECLHNWIVYHGLGTQAAEECCNLCGKAKKDGTK